MRNNKLRTPIFLLLPLLLPLLMGNSPSPYPFPSTYEDFTTTEVETVFDGLNFTYSTILTNTGTGYISLDHSYVVGGTSNTYIHDFSEYDYNTYVGPEGVYDLSFTSQINYTTFHFKIMAYSTFVEDITYSVITPIVKEEFVDETNTYYTYTFSIESNLITNEYYDALVTIEYDGKTFWLGSDIDPDVNEIKLMSSEDMNVEEIEITNITFVKGRDRSSIGGTIVHLLIFGSIIAGIFFIAMIVIIILLLIVLIRKISKRNKLKNPI